MVSSERLKNVLIPIKLTLHTIFRNYFLLDPQNHFYNDSKSGFSFPYSESKLRSIHTQRQEMEQLPVSDIRQRISSPSYDQKLSDFMDSCSNCAWTTSEMSQFSPWPDTELNIQDTN